MRTQLAASLIFSLIGSGAAIARDWTGPYIGAHIGYAWGEASNTWRSPSAGYPDWEPDGDIAYDSASGGLHLGYLWQSGWLAYGIEGDITWASLKGDDSKFAGLVNELEMSYVATIRGRIGVAQGSSLFYATGGIAFSEVDKNDLTYDQSVSNDAVGWTIGGGYERSFWSNWRARIEYQYIDLGSVSSGLTYSHRAEEIDVQSVRAGVSYGF